MTPDDVAAQSAVEDGSVATLTLLRDRRLLSFMLLSGMGLLSTQAVIPALPTIQSWFGVSDGRIGLVLTAFFLPPLLGTPFIGAICDIYGRRLVALVSLAGFGVAGLLLFFAPSFEVFLALRVLQGVCFAGLTPLSIAFIGDFYQGEAGTTAQGLRLSTNGLVITIVPAVTGVLVELAWNYPFVLYAASFPALVFVYWHFPTAASIDQNEGSVTAALREWLRGVLESLNDRGLLVLILGGFMLFGVRYAMLTVAPLLGTRSLGLRPATVGVALSALGVVRIVTCPQAGRVASRLSRKVAFMLTMGIVAAGLTLFALAESLVTFVAAIVVFAVGYSLFNPTLNDAVAASAPAETRSGVVSAMTTGKNLANTLGPVAAGGLLVVTDFRTVFLVTVAMAVGFVVVLAVALDPEQY